MGGDMVDDPGGTGHGAGLLRITERLDGIPMCWVLPSTAMARHGRNELPNVAG
jgi:hypothetical protein